MEHTETIRRTSDGCPAATSPFAATNGSAVYLGNVFGDSATAMDTILKLHFPTGTILDVNYGHGVFYKKHGRERVTGVDIRGTGDIVADNRNLPMADDSYDVGVCDPPYKRGNRNTRYEERYGVAPCTEPRVTRQYLEALPELLRICRMGIIVKCQDASDGHTYHPRHITLANWMKTTTGLNLHDIAVVAREVRLSAHRWGTPRYMQQSLSYFLIWKWKSKRPYRQVRA